MKITHFFEVLIAMVLLSCNASPTENTGIDLKSSGSDSTFNLCFTSFIKRDTVLFNALVSGDSIKGSLGYKLYEKQQQNGHVIGKMTGDTITGLFTFMASDSEYVNEVVFLQKDSILVEGIGERVFDSGKFVFKDRKKISFTGIELIKDDCRQVPSKNQ